MGIIPNIIIIVLAIVSGIIFAVGQAVNPWWVALIWLAIVIIANAEIISYKKS